MVKLVLGDQTLGHVLGQSVARSALAALALQILVPAILDGFCDLDTISTLVRKEPIQTDCASIRVDRVDYLTLEQIDQHTAQLVRSLLVPLLTGPTLSGGLIFLTIWYRW